ncbi:MAG: histone deacetylase [Planctomycetaceae bacterium]|nr:histone deacetylase [Planctomycetaceae bacterium]
MRLFYSDTFELPLPPGHRFPMAKYGRLRQRVAEANWAASCKLELPPAASDAELTLVHCSEYLRRVTAGDLSVLEQKRIGFPWSEKMVERCRRSTGASIAASQAAILDRVAVNMAGGTHHALPDAGSGYCVFNDVAVAARVLQQQRLAARVLFIDLDVHQGNGTAAITAGDPTLFSFSMHGDNNFPFRKTASDLDVALSDGTGDEDYLRALQDSLSRIEASFAADFVFYVAGADAWMGDRLGKLGVSKAGLKARDEMVFDWCRSHRLPISICMAGGYAPDIEDIVDIHFQTIATAFQYYEDSNSGKFR